FDPSTWADPCTTWECGGTAALGEDQTAATGAGRGLKRGPGLRRNVRLRVVRGVGIAELHETEPIDVRRRNSASSLGLPHVLDLFPLLIPSCVTTLRFPARSKGFRTSAPGSTDARRLRTFAQRRARRCRRIGAAEGI